MFVEMMILSWGYWISRVYPCNKIRSFLSVSSSWPSWVGDCERIYINGGLSVDSIFLVPEPHWELIVGHSWWIYQKTVESVESWALSLRTVNSGFRSWGKFCLQKVLSFSLIVESESWVGFQGDEDVVGVDVAVSWLVESWVRWSCGWWRSSGRWLCGRWLCGWWLGGWRSWCSADGRLSRAGVSLLNFAVDASWTVAVSSITFFSSNDESIATLGSTLSILIWSISRSRAGEALGGRWAGLAWSRASNASFVVIEVLSIGAVNWSEN